MFEPVFQESILKRAQQKKKAEICVHDLREYTLDKHRKVDDRPFGGGSGMVMQVEPIFRAVKYLKAKRKAGKKNTRVILMTPQGGKLNQAAAKRISRYKHVILMCGHYEGVDERVRQCIADEEVSIGDYILTGGELPAMVLVDCIVRLLPGVLGDKNSLNCESFEGNLLEYPHYTRPADFQGMKVPGVLLSGNHKEIEQWRKQQSVLRTHERRPDLITKNKKQAL